MELARHLIVTALNDANLDESRLYESCEDLAWYGHTCFGIAGSYAELLVFFIALARLDDDDMFCCDLARALRSTLRSYSMGPNHIFYFPGFTVEPENSAVIAQDPGR